jgi:cell division protein FtsQ
MTGRQAGEPRQVRRFLRRAGNLKVRRERQQRVAGRVLTRIAVIAGAVGFASLTMGATVRWLATSPALEVSYIEVAGAERAEVATLRSLAAGARSQNIILLDLRRVAANVGTHPWVKNVIVRKRFPDTVEIRVEEREPCALMILEGEPFLVDTTGTPVDRFGPRYAGWSFPAFRGLDGIDPVERARRCRRAAGQVQALSEAAPELHAALAEVDLSDPVRTVLRFPGNGETLQVNPDNWLQNLDAFRALQGTLRGRHPRAQYVDLRWEGRLTVLPDLESHP